MFAADFFQTLNDRTGWNFPIFYNEFLAAKFLRGIGLTVEIGVAATLGAIALGLACAVARHAGRPLASAAVTAYVEFFRNTPGLAQLYFLFFGLGSWSGLSVPAVIGGEPPVSAFTFVVISLAIHQGAFVAEVFRAALDGIPRGIHESAAALGYGRWQSLRRILLPLALRTALPGLGNVAAQIVKGTAMAYAVAVPEALYVAHEIWSESFNVVEMMNVVLVTYLLLMGVVTLVVRVFEAWLRVPGYGR